MKIAALLLLLAQDPVEVDLELLNSKHVAVQVKVNGEGPFRLIFDTGAPVTLISNRVAKKAGIKTGGAGLLGLGGQAKVDRFEVGGAVAEKMPAIIMDHPTVGALAQVVGELDGIVGFTFFAKFETVIDYQAGKLRLTPCEYEPTDVMASVQKMLTGSRKRELISRTVSLGLTLEEKTPVVKTVVKGGAAEEAGLRAGDFIISFDGRWILAPRDLYEAVSFIKPGEKAPMRVKREGEERVVWVKGRPGF